MAEWPEDPADPDQRASFFESARPLIEQLTPERIAADGAAYLDHLQRVAESGRAAITGYCLRGRLGWRIAAAQPDRVAALAAFHPGGLVGDGADSPHLSADALRGVELCLGFADEDPSMSAEQIETLERALEEAGVRFHADVYAGARHGFTMEDSPAFDEAARERQFRELGALLKRTLG